MKLFLDVTLLQHALSARPRRDRPGRVCVRDGDFRQHKHFDAVTVLTTPLFSGAFRGSVIEEILNRVALAWRLDCPPAQDGVYQDLKRYLETAVDERRMYSFRVRGQLPLSRAIRQGYYPVRSLVRASARLQRRLLSSQNQIRYYFNSSHTQLENLERFLWTASAGLKCISSSTI